MKSLKGQIVTPRISSTPSLICIICKDSDNHVWIDQKDATLSNIKSMEEDLTILETLFDCIYS